MPNFKGKKSIYTDKISMGGRSEEVADLKIHTCKKKTSITGMWREIAGPVVEWSGNGGQGNRVRITDGLVSQSVLVLKRLSL